MRVLETGLPGVVVVEPAVHGDHRGFFMETWNAGRYREHGLPGVFVQSNVSRSGAGVLRGLHFQNPQPQGKLISVFEGRIFDVAVDIRPDSPHYREWVGVELSAENFRQLYVPEGFAHGFCVLGESALISYLCTTEYRAEYDRAIAWNDPSIGVRWPLKDARVSAKDGAALPLDQWDPADLPRVEA